MRLLAEAMLSARGVSQPSDAELAEAADRAEATLRAAGIKTKKAAAKKGQADLGAIAFESEALVFVSGQQLASLAQVALADGDVDAKAAKQAVDTDHGIDVALFGRMVASSPDLNVDAAVQVAHAISTHTVDPQGDYYTAVDDEKDTDEDAGAGMMGIIEFSSATLYRYAAVSLDLLAENLGDSGVAADAVGAFLRSFLTSMPSGKKNSMAADTLPSAVLVTLRDSRPVSLVGAFERPVPVTEEGYVSESVRRMAQRANDVATNFGVAPLRSWAVAEDSLKDVFKGVAEVTDLNHLVESAKAASFETPSGPRS